MKVYHKIFKVYFAVIGITLNQSLLIFDRKGVLKIFLWGDLKHFLKGFFNQNIFKKSVLVPFFPPKIRENVVATIIVVGPLNI